MNHKAYRSRRHALLRSFGWKKNLLAIFGTFFVLFLIEYILPRFFRFRMFTVFDPAAVLLPLIGLLLGIWGIIGCMLEYTHSVLSYAMFASAIKAAPLSDYFPSTFPFTFAATLVYCTLPVVLWDLFSRKEGTVTRYPRLDTSSHVIRYYLIMVLDVAAYIALLALSSEVTFSGTSLLDWTATFTQYLNVTLIVGIPMLILISVIRSRNITINERMVLAFLVVGVLGSVLGGYLIYRTSFYLDPTLFRDYDTVLEQVGGEWTAAATAAVSRYFDFWNWYYVMLAVLLNGLLLIEMLLMRSIERRVTRTCVTMVNEIDTYTDHLRKVTAEKERIGTELDVASKIQRDMLPGVFPPFPDRCQRRTRIPGRLQKERPV